MGNKIADKVKMCVKCKEEKSLDLFSDHIMKRDGKQSWCMECNRRTLREKYAQKKAEIAAMKAQQEKEVK